MRAVSHAEKRQTLAKWFRVALVLLGVVVLTLFLIYRFSESKVQKAERLFREHSFSKLRSFTQSALKGEEANALLMGYYISAEFVLNPNASLASLMGNLEVIDNRPIFRREVLERLASLRETQGRAAEIISVALLLESPPTKSMQSLALKLLQTHAPLESLEIPFSKLATIFPEHIFRVAARELQLRDRPGTSSTVIRRLGDGEILFVRLREGKTTVSGKNGHWAFVMDKTLSSGWVFDAYLKQAMPENSAAHKSSE